jgi:type II secretory pathway component GspD/PulD (secretin)
LVQWFALALVEVHLPHAFKRIVLYAWLSRELISMRRAFATAVFLSLTSLTSRELKAAEPTWPAAPYEYVVVDQDLRAVLEQFGFNTGLRIVLSDTVQGRVRGRLPSALPRQFFDHLTEMFGLDWYYDGAAIAVSAKSEAQTQLVTLKDTSFSQLQSALEAAGFVDLRYQLRPGPERSVAIASGPPRYLAIVKQVAATLSPDQEPKQNIPPKHNVTIIRGSSVSRIEFP